MGFVVLNITWVGISWRQGMISAATENSIFIQYWYLILLSLQVRNSSQNFQTCNTFSNYKLIIFKLYVNVISYSIFGYYSKYMLIKCYI